MLIAKYRANRVVITIYKQLGNMPFSHREINSELTLTVGRVILGTRNVSTKEVLSAHTLTSDVSVKLTAALFLNVNVAPSAL